MKMKLLLPGLTLAVMTAILFMASCSLPQEPDLEGGNGGGEEEEEQEEITQEEADDLLESLSFTANTKIAGNVPAVQNTSSIKVEGDTLYALPGIKMPIRLSNPGGVSVAGWFIAVNNSSFYYDVPVDDVEDSDTVTLVLIEFPEDRETPYDIWIIITPYDDTKTPIDVIDIPVVVEKPSENECDILVDGDTTNQNPDWEWVWHWTLVTNPNDEATFIDAQNRIFASTQNPTGCCNPQAACPAYVCNPTTGVCQWEYNAQVTAVTSYAIMNEFFNFYKDGTFVRFTSERKVNFDPVATDWCNEIPEYSYNFDRVLYYGTHDYMPGNTSISYVSTRKDCDDPLGLCGYGSRPGQVIHSCHIMMIIVDRLNIEFAKETRMYRRSPGSIVWRS